MSEHGHDINEGLLHRLVNFSDAVFAIILTLLALELRPPEVHDPSELASALVDMAPHFFAFALSFAVLGVFWLAHMAILRRTILFDWAVAALNLVLLFTLALAPFAAALVGDNGSVGTAWQFYCGVMVAAAIAQMALLVVHLRDEGRLVGGLAKGEYGYRLLRAASPGIAFGSGLVLSLGGHDLLAGFCWLLFAPVFLIARLIKPKDPTPPLPELGPGGTAA